MGSPADAPLCANSGRGSSEIISTRSETYAEVSEIDLDAGPTSISQANMPLSEVLREIRLASIAGYRRIYKFRRDHKRWPNIFRPRTFNEKILYRSIFDRRPIFQTLSDKLAVRSYVKGRVGNLACIPRVLFQTRCADDLLTATLPYCFVLKSNHGQAHTYLHSAGEPDRTRLVAIAETWLAWDNYEQRDQWCYKDIPKTIFVEEHLTAGGPEPPDYKFFCFDGIPRFIEFRTKRSSGPRRDFYDSDWRSLEMSFVDPVSGHAHPRPPNLDKMIAIASRLSSDFDFIRVDLYDLGDRVVFGEITCYPQNGRGKFKPPSWDVEFGRHWIIRC
jgi:teichuronopeptide biosynthesis TupA-like protein